LILAKSSVAGECVALDGKGIKFLFGRENLLIVFFRMDFIHYLLWRKKQRIERTWIFSKA
jgi:hypothetical protein